MLGTTLADAAQDPRIDCADGAVGESGVSAQREPRAHDFTYKPPEL
jgi:hypothetical protein